jgi:hypothetical protein
VDRLRKVSVWFSGAEIQGLDITLNLMFILFEASHLVANPKQKQEPEHLTMGIQIRGWFRIRKLRQLRNKMRQTKKFVAPSRRNLLRSEILAAESVEIRRKAKAQQLAPIRQSSKWMSADGQKRTVHFFTISKQKKRNRKGSFKHENWCKKMLILLIKTH